MGKRKNAANQSAQSYERQLRFGSMMRKLLLPSGSRRWITPIVMLLLLLGIIAGAFIVHSVTQRHVQLDDGTVWITSLKDRKAARFNAKNKDVNAGVSSAASRFDVAQHNGSTVISEGTKASNIAASTISETGNTVIKTDIETIVGGDTAAFINVKTGNVWVGSASDVKSVNPTTDKPNMKLGSGGKIAVTHDGTVYGYRASDGAVLSLDGPQGTNEQTDTIKGAPHAESFTVIGATPVVAAKSTVYWPQGSAAINLQGDMTLQAPSTDGKQNGWVAVATPRGLATVNLSTKKTSETPNSGKGEAAQPVSTGGCVFAAWAQKANNYAKACSADGSDTTFDTLTNINTTSELIFRTNHRLVILNDVVNGNVWNPQESTKVIKIQWNKVETKQSKQQEQNNDSANNQHNFSKTCSSQSGQIKAEDDLLGARTGSQQILDVLRNDEQTDCSVLRITSVSAPDGANISVSPVYDGRYLQLDASAAAEGSVSFSYEISDGRGQTSNANVNLTLVGNDDNAPQQTDTPPEIDVEQGATYTTNALGSFSDPDGDPLTLVSATPQNTDQVTVSTRADGQLVFNAGSMSSGRASIEVTVSDGQQTGTGMVYFSVKPANTLAAVIDPVVKQTTPDARTTVSLKQYVHGTSAEPTQLTAVETPSGASTAMNATDMSFTFSAANPGTYHVPYTITQGTIPMTGLARIEVQAATGDSAKPIAANDVALLGADNTAIVEPLANDVDPMGGVLSVTNVTADAASGIKTDVKSVNPTTDKPNMKLGSGGKIAVTHDGTVYGYRASDGAVLSLDGPQGTNEQTDTIKGAPHAESFTVIGATPVVAAKSTVYWPQGSAAINLQGDMTLQAPSTDGKQNGWVAVATPRGLATVNLSTKKTSETPNSGKGEAAQPVSTGGCVFAAWAQKANNYAKACSADGSDTTFDTLTNINTTSELIFRTNHRLVILNDVVNGNVWNPQESTKVIKIQWNKVETKQSKQQEQNNDSANNQHNFSKTCSSQSGQIKAEDDLLGARTGSQQILDVLRNDEQTDCSVLRITSVSAPDGANISVSPVYDGRYLQLDASAAAEGSVSFSYEISDGRGQTSNANVNLTLVGNDDNAPQQTDTPPEIDVEQGATYTTNALGSFSDPDGDPLTLVSATPQNTDQVTVSTRADGQLVFNAGSMSSGRASIEVTVSDGQQTGTGMVYFSVKPANTLAAVIDPVVKQTTPDARTTVSLKQYVHGTSAEPTQLTAVETPSGASTAMNATDMSFTFSAANPGTYHVPYTITQGTIPMTGLARIEVQAATGDSAKPIAANDVALLGADNTAIVEPLANDVDPMGGVLSVTNVTADAASGIKTGVVSNKRVYITARQVPTEPVQIKYSVANAAGTSTGVIVLQPPALTTSNSIPKADNITTQVRTDGIVSIDVLDHVTYSDGTTVNLQNDLQYDKSTFKGLVFVSGNTVRYQASDQTGSFPVTYTIKDNLGNAASATITINVHQKDAENKAAPTPSDVEAQVAAGQKVQIPITLTGIDADGDDVQLLGLGNKAPTLGRICEVGATYLVYEAYADSAGTDTFSYAVEDWTGQRSQAQIRVGVFTSGTDSGVYARDDEITLRPNTAATVPVAQNDISGDSTDLTVSEDVESQDISNVTVVDNALAFTTPQQAGTYYVVYTVKDKAGLSDTATLTVNIDGNATIEPPTAYDYRVPSSATIDKKSVDVDVSQWIANPSGSADELHVAVDDSATDHAHVKGGDKSTTITVELTDEARAVPYTVTNTTYGIMSTAFIQVPAYGVFPPILRPKAPALKVNARETITINIADYVRVGAGKTAYVDGADSVSATKAADGDLYVNDQTLKFTAPKDYSGPASITFTAVDGKRDKNNKVKIINSAVLTLPITVIGRDAPAPTFSSPTIDVVAGESATTPT